MQPDECLQEIMKRYRSLHGKLYDLTGRKLIYLYQSHGNSLSSTYHGTYPNPGAYGEGLVVLVRTELVSVTTGGYVVGMVFLDSNGHQTHSFIAPHSSYILDKLEVCVRGEALESCMIS